MKFRIMENEYGKYVQRKSFGIWRNWLVNVNCFTCLDKQYYTEYSIIDLEYRIRSNNKPPNKDLPKILKEFEIE